MCDICADTGYVMQDIGTATIPDYIEVPCACNPDPFGTAYEDARYLCHSSMFSPDRERWPVRIHASGRPNID
jgi:hypothetical protein